MQKEGNFRPQLCPIRANQGFMTGFRPTQETLFDTLGLPDLPLKTLRLSAKTKACQGLASLAGSVDCT
eukprot:scaffold298746_cov19-Tisochrysis_lutea.AAC.1